MSVTGTRRPGRRRQRSVQWQALGVLAVTLVAASIPTAFGAREAASLYRDYCAVCHGENGDGNSHVRQGMRPPPRDFTSTGARRELTRNRMIESVREGRTGTAMVAWTSRLSDSEIEGLVDHIRSRFMAAKPSTAARGGQAIYRSTCSVCHGENGKGALWGQSSLDPPPRDFTGAAAQRELTRERMIAAVVHGRPGTAMAAFGTQLGRKDIEGVVDYIRSTFMDNTGVATGLAPGHATAGDATTRTDASHSAPLPFGLRGDLQAGRTSYLQNCVACHGVDGDGRGPRAAFIFPKPRNFRHPNSRMSYTRPVLFRAIKNGVVGREMPAWGKVLTDQQIADVSEFVYQAFVRSEGKSAGRQ